MVQVKGKRLRNKNSVLQDFPMRLYARSSKIGISSLKKSLMFVSLLLTGSLSYASCAPTTLWSTPVDLSNSGGITSAVYSAATAAGFMAVWADSANNAHYSFSADGTTWASGLISSATTTVASNSDVFVAGNNTGFMATWIDSANNGWSSFSADKGTSWSAALQINPNTLSLDSNSDVYVSAGASGFVATMIGNDENAYVSFSTGTEPWTIPTQVTTDGSVYNQNWVSQTTRGFVASTVAEDNSCMLTWINNALSTASAQFDSVSSLTTTSVYPIVSVGFFESVPIVAALHGYFMTASRANVGNGVTYFSVATTPTNWLTGSLFLQPNNTPLAGPWVASNHAGFMSSWIVGASAGVPGSPMWTFSSNNGFNWTPLCSILPTLSTTIGGQVGLSANSQGFLATWLDSNDANAYASFYSAPAPTPTPATPFVALLQQKYGPLL